MGRRSRGGEIGAGQSNGGFTRWEDKWRSVSPSLWGSCGQVKEKSPRMVSSHASKCHANTRSASYLRVLGAKMRESVPSVPVEQGEGREREGEAWVEDSPREKTFSGLFKLRSRFRVQLLRIFDQLVGFVENRLLTATQAFHLREIPMERMGNAARRRRITRRRPVESSVAGVAVHRIRGETCGLIAWVRRCRGEKGHIEQMGMTSDRFFHGDVRQVLRAGAEKRLRSFRVRPRSGLEVQRGGSVRIDSAAGHRWFLRF